MAKIISGSRTIVPGNGEFQELLNGNGERRATVFIGFPGETFVVPPTVVVSVNQLDVIKDDNTRIEVSAEAVTDDGFNLTFHTWADTKVFSVGATWIAYQN